MNLSKGLFMIKIVLFTSDTLLKTLTQPQHIESKISLENKTLFIETISANIGWRIYLSYLAFLKRDTILTESTLFHIYV